MKSASLLSSRSLALAAALLAVAPGRAAAERATGGAATGHAAPAGFHHPKGLAYPPANGTFYAADCLHTRLLISLAAWLAGLPDASSATEAIPFDWSVPVVTPASASRATGPQPRAAGQYAYVDPTDPNASGETYLGTTYTVPAGGDTFYALYVGYNGAATVSQSADTLTLYTLLLGYNPGGNGTYNLGGGTLSVGNEFVGYGGTGAITQTGGANDLGSSALLLGYVTGGSGTYNLSGGTLSAGAEVIGFGGTGAFTQGAGATNTVSGALSLGAGSGTGGNGAYTLNAGTLSTARTQVGDAANTSVFNQNGGTHTTATLGLTGASTSSVGIYNLNAGTLTVGAVVSGDGDAAATGTSTFNFNGGTLQASANTTAFFGGLTKANVLAGGAIIDTQYKFVTLSQSLLTGTAAGVADGGLTKLGLGTLTLTGTNTYTGPTNVNAGTLEVNGAGTGTGTVSVPNNGTTLAGTGTLAAPVYIAYGLLQPGNTTGGVGTAAASGRLTMGALTLSSAAQAIFDINSAAAYDQAFANGNITLGGYLTLHLPSGATFAPSTVFDLFHAQAGGALTGTFSNFANGGVYTYGSQSFRATYTATDFDLTAVAVPEPATWAGGVLLLSAAGLTLLRHRRAVLPG